MQYHYERSITMLLWITDLSVHIGWKIEQWIKNYRASKVKEKTLIIIDPNKTYATDTYIVGALFANQTGIMTLPEVAHVLQQENTSLTNV